jgi:hypothetical protein
MPILPIVLGLGPLLKEVPALIRAGTELYNRIRNQKCPRTRTDGSEALSIQALNATVTNIEERLETAEVNAESQAALLMQLAKHNAVLVRWLFALAAFAVVSGGVAVAALLMVVL